VINGSKAYITNAGSDITGLITVAAVTGADDDDKKQISTIIVPSGTPGLTVAKGYSKVGWCAADCHELGFDNVRVPVENLLGELGRGYAQFLSTLDEVRVGVSALAPRRQRC
jgi:short-chain 2-methylacyl-CoA dehydrogenase